MSDQNPSQPSTLKVNVSETVKSNDVPMGGHGDSRSPSDIEKHIQQQKAMAEFIRLQGRFIPAHNKKARWVKAADLPKVLTDGKDLLNMCRIPRGEKKGAISMAHTMVNDQDPLRFFVINNGVNPSGMVIINPVIIDSTKVPTLQTEGCMAFPDKPAKNLVPRFNKITVTYQTLVKREQDKEPILTNPITETLNGKSSFMFQHECSHLNGANIYDKDYDGNKSKLLGDGLPIDPAMWNKELIESTQPAENIEIKNNK